MRKYDRRIALEKEVLRLNRVIHNETDDSLREKYKKVRESHLNLLEELVKLEIIEPLTKPTLLKRMILVKIQQVEKKLLQIIDRVWHSSWLFPFHLLFFDIILKVWVSFLPAGILALIIGIISFNFDYIVSSLILLVIGTIGSIVMYFYIKSEPF